MRTGYNVMITTKYGTYNSEDFKAAASKQPEECEPDELRAYIIVSKQCLDDVRLDMDGQALAYKWFKGDENEVERATAHSIRHEQHARAYAAREREIFGLEALLKTLEDGTRKAGQQPDDDPFKDE